MAATDKLFAGSIPEIYDRFLVPLIFESSRATSPSGSPSSNRRAYWKQLQELAFSAER